MLATAVHRNFCGACFEKSMLFSDDPQKACFFVDDECEQCGGSGLSPRVLNLLFIGSDATKTVALQHAYNRQLMQLLADLRAALISSGVQRHEAGELQQTMMLLAARITKTLGEG